MDYILTKRKWSEKARKSAKKRNSNAFHCGKSPN